MHSNKHTFLEKLEHQAEIKLERSTYDFIAGGAGTEWGLKNNRIAFSKYAIIPQVLQDTNTVDVTMNFLNHKFQTPIIMAPCAFHKLVCPDGEVTTACAAKKIGTIFTLSTMASCTIEEIAKASNVPKWFQLYFLKDREMTRSLIQRAEQAGYQAIILTIDVPAMGLRWRDINNQFKLPAHIDAANFRNSNFFNLSEKIEGSKVKAKTDQQFDAGITWDTIDWITSITKLPLILKGILRSQDAAEALKHKISAIIVSNHGGRQLDSVVSSLDQLAEIAKVVNKRMPIFLDGGIRSGEDIFKALALGASGVLIGRPILWSLAVGGEELLINVFDKLQQELVLTMRLAGCNSIKKIHDLGLELIFNERLHLQNKLTKYFKCHPAEPSSLIEQKFFSRL